MEEQAAGTPRVATRAPTFMGWSYFSALCCCLPLGVYAIRYSRKTRDANNMGDEIQAYEHSKTARNLNIASLVIGPIFITFYVIYHLYDGGDKIGRPYN